MASTASGVLVPDHIALNLERERAVDRQLALWQVYDRLAKDLDSRLSVIWVRDDVDPTLIYGDMVPGRWHFHRDNTDLGAPDRYIPIVTDSGGFREPVASDIDRLRQMDLHNPDVARRVQGAGERTRRAKEKQQAAEREARIETGTQVLKALESPSVLISDDVQFKARAKGRTRGRNR